MFVGKFSSLMTMLPLGLYLILLANAVRAELTFGTLATSSRLTPIIFPKSRRDSIMMGSHSSQFSPKSRQSARYSWIAFRTLIDGGPVPALSKYARREVTGISFLTRSMFKEGKASRCSRVFRVWSIKGMLGGVEGLSTSF